MEDGSIAIKIGEDGVGRLVEEDDVFQVEHPAGGEATLVKDSELSRIIYEACGAATRPLMQDHPKYTFPSERVMEAVKFSLRENGLGHIVEPDQRIASVETKGHITEVNAADEAGGKTNYWAVCSCGWRSSDMPSSDHAHSEAQHHANPSSLRSK